ncbi:hypothetical protein ONZ45_g7722 [Pleurotus djamor]|nr:hypothetical protein ONZ45_g7722 [Pleurotus djamor]
MSTSTNDETPIHVVRSEMQIVWSCVAIIFACTWTAIHPNVPSARVGSSHWRMGLRRVRMMLWTILVPEMMVAWAAKQWVDARRISRGIETEETATDRKWTQTHSYFLLMGGYAVQYPNRSGWKPVSVDDVLECKVSISLLEEAEINNWSKSDTVAKTLVILQVTWFVVQLCARVHQGLEITQLEIMTLAYAVLCAILYGMWLWKPYDVRRPTIIAGSPSVLSPRTYPTLNKQTFLRGMWLWIVQARVVHDPHFVSADLSNPVPLTSAIMFGGINLVAIAFEFPTRWEYTLWIGASICLLVVPVIYGGLLLNTVSIPLLRITIFTTPILLNLYFAARLFLLVDSFVLLRNLPSSARELISWTTYLPHI